MSEVIRQTLDNEDWLKENRKKVVLLFPETWTHILNTNLLMSVRYNFKLLGIDYRTEDEFAMCLAICERRKILLRDGYTLRRGIN